MKTQDQIQREALNRWVEIGKKGTIEAVTGIGKTFIGLHAMCTMPTGSKVLFLAETSQRQMDLNKDLLLYFKLFKIDISKKYAIEFACYQSAYKWKDRHFDIVIADEIHDSITPEYSKFYFNNTYSAIIGLSATIDGKTKYDWEDGWNGTMTKGEILSKIAPICYRYCLDDSIRNGTTRKLNVYVISHRLNKTTYNIAAGSKTRKFYTTEHRNYNYWNDLLTKCTDEADNIDCPTTSEYIAISKKYRAKILALTNRMARILYNLPSKAQAILELLEVLQGKTIVFSNSLDFLDLITENVVSSNESDCQNKQTRAAFDDGRIDLIGSFKMLKQGANLKGAQNEIIASYYSKEKDLIQRIGRLRKDEDKEGNIFIFRTIDTREELWYDLMTEKITMFNIIECNDIYDCILKYLQNNESNSQLERVQS